MRKRLLLLTLVLLLLTTAGLWWFGVRRAAAPAIKVPIKPASITPVQPAAFNKAQFSLTDPTSPWVIVNKQHPLQPTNYAPTDLVVPNVALAAPGQPQMQMRAAAAAALEQLFAGATQAGYQLKLQSGYRSYDYQVGLYNSYVQSVGQSAADSESARPGYSEHQSGLAVDISAASGSCTLEACFGTTPEGIWLAVNAYKYGFLLRYPADKVDVTGYEYEPWHFRYIGTDLAAELQKQNVQTLEEFFGVTGGSSY